MRLLVLGVILCLSFQIQAASDALEQIFPNGYAVFALRNVVEGGTLMIIRPVKVENRFASINKQYLRYDVFFDTQEAEQLQLRSHWEGRESALFDYKILLYDKFKMDNDRENPDPVQGLTYVISKDLKSITARWQFPITTLTEIK